jgi:hypothetical protein
MTVATVTMPWLTHRVDHGVSDDAEQLRRLYREFLDGTDAPSARESTVGKALERVATEASVLGWDGYGGLPISEAVYEQAKAFAAVIPSDIVEPDVVPEPDGEIAFEWDFGPWRVLSVSVGPEGVLSYAVSLGPHTRDHGTAVFVDQMPRSIQGALRRLLAAQCVPLR